MAGKTLVIVDVQPTFCAVGCCVSSKIWDRKLPGFLI